MHGRSPLLVSTFGFDERKVLRAMRRLQFDRLHLIAGPDSFRSPGYRRLRDLVGQMGAGVEATAVDPYDFAACFRAAVSLLSRYPRDRYEVRVNVSGGTKVLADATILAAFHEGVECWHVEGDAAVRLPVIRGLRFADRLTEAERTILRLVTRARKSEDIVRAAVASGLSASAARGALASLIRGGLLKGDVVAGHAVVSPVPPVQRPVHERETALK